MSSSQKHGGKDSEGEKLTMKQVDTGLCWGVESSTWCLPRNNDVKEVTRVI